VLNTDLVNDAIKSVQTVGQQGERDIHRRPLEEVPIPRYDPADPDHQRLAELSRTAHVNASGVELDAQRDRRRYLLENEIVEIEEITERVIAAAQAPAPVPGSELRAEPTQAE
jgi:hypothetical protein